MKKLVQILAVAVCLASAASFVGCSGDRTHKSTGEVIDDAAIAAKIKGALIADPVTKARDIKVNVYRGDVQLSGFVDNAAERKKAEDITWGINGVRSVKNDLEIKG
jgi:hyperosmotically inducible protein